MFMQQQQAQQQPNAILRHLLNISTSNFQPISATNINPTTNLQPYNAAYPTTTTNAYLVVDLLSTLTTYGHGINSEQQQESLAINNNTPITSDTTTDTTTKALYETPISLVDDTCTPVSGKEKQKKKERRRMKINCATRS